MMLWFFLQSPVSAASNLTSILHPTVADPKRCSVQYTVGHPLS
jgi:hypothetical protein